MTSEQKNVNAEVDAAESKIKIRDSEYPQYFTLSVTGRGTARVSRVEDLSSEVSTIYRYQVVVIDPRTNEPVPFGIGDIEWTTVSDDISPTQTIQRTFTVHGNPYPRDEGISGSTISYEDWSSTPGLEGYYYITRTVSVTTVSYSVEVESQKNEHGEDMGIVTGGGDYFSGEDCTVTATGKTIGGHKYEFRCWKDEDGSTVSYDAECTFACFKNRKLKAFFEGTGLLMYSKSNGKLLYKPTE